MWIDTENTYPYRNLAMEEYMTIHVPGGDLGILSGRNRHTVVIWQEPELLANAR